MRSLTGLAFGLLLVSCSEDPAPPSIPPPAELELIAPGVTGGAAPCVRRGDDLRQTLTGQVAVRNFTLRPPLACTVAECGTVRLTLEQNGHDDPWVFESAERWISIPTLGLPDGRFTVTASLRDTFGNAYPPKGEPDRASCTNCVRAFTLAASCGDEPEPASEPEAAPDGPVATDGGASPPTTDGGVSPSEVDAAVPSMDAGDVADAAANLLDAGTPPDAAATEPDAASATPDAAVPNAPLDAGPAAPEDAGMALDAASDAG